MGLLGRRSTMVDCGYVEHGRMDGMLVRNGEIRSRRSLLNYSLTYTIAIAINRRHCLGSVSWAM